MYHNRLQYLRSLATPAVGTSRQTANQSTKQNKPKLNPTNQRTNQPTQSFTSGILQGPAQCSAHARGYCSLHYVSGGSLSPQKIKYNFIYAQSWEANKNQIQTLLEKVASAGETFRESTGTFYSFLQVQRGCKAI
jgi:hypothetical protein